VNPVTGRRVGPPPCRSRKRLVPRRLKCRITAGALVAAAILVCGCADAVTDTDAGLQGVWSVAQLNGQTLPTTLQTACPVRVTAGEVEFAPDARAQLRLTNAWTTYCAPHDIAFDLRYSRVGNRLTLLWDWQPVLRGTIESQRIRLQKVPGSAPAYDSLTLAR
jgi:hypothetical protein